MLPTKQKAAKGQVSLVSLPDGSAATFYIKPNRSTQQIHTSGNQALVPDYTSTPLVLTPELRVGGKPITDISCVWKEGVNTLQSNPDNTLTINTNLESVQRMISCTATYVDPNSFNESEVSTYVILSRLDTTGTSVTVILDPNGSVDYVDQNNKVCNYKANVYYGSEDITSQQKYAIQYKWTIYNMAYNKFVGFSQDAPQETGALTASASNNTPIYLKRSEAGDYDFVPATQDDYCVKLVRNEIELTADAIDVKETIQCEAIVRAANGGLPGDVMGSDSDIATVRDFTDPYTCQIKCTTLALTSKANASVLEASLYQNGIDVTNYIDNIKYDWDAYTVSTNTGAATKMWPEYTRSSSNTYTLITEGTETGNGYWLTGGTVNGNTVTSPETAQATNTKKVTVYRSQVGNASNIECLISW